MKTLKTLFFLTILAAFAHAGIGVPAQNLSIASLGIEYNGMMRGQYITASDIASHENIHTVCFHYAPVPYVLFSAGLGVDRFTTDAFAGQQFKGGYGFAPMLGLSLFTPFLFNDILRFCGGATMLYFNSKDTRDYAYRAPVVDPYLGLIFSASRVVDFGLGARGHLIFGTMGNVKTNSFSNFSNRNLVRGYLQFTLHSPSDGAYLNLEADMSPKFSEKWENGPVESSLSISVGVILRAPRHEKEKDIETKYFPAYKEMKEKQKQMEGELEE